VSAELSRRLAAEVVGTFLLVMLGVGAVLVYVVAPPLGALLAAFAYDAIARPRAVRATPAEAMVTES